MKKILFAFCFIALITSCKKEQQPQPTSKPAIEGGLSVTIEKGQLSNDGIVYNQTPAWLSVWNTHGHVLDIWPTDALQGITNDKTANTTITADYHNTQANGSYHLKLAPGTYMVFVILSLPAGATGQFAYSYKTFTVTSTSGYVAANKKFGCNVANAAFESWN
jgi:hypothetical protein